MTTTTPTTTETLAAGTPWVERYRPKTLKDVSHQTEVVSTLENAVKTGRLPHLLFYGPPGSGKTSVALALCRQLWHPSQWRRRVLELNASDERGISVVRDKIKHFASLTVGGGGGGEASTAAVTKNKKMTSFFQVKQSNKSSSAAAAAASSSSASKENDDEKYPNPPFKIIILDEADTVTPDAQAALRRIIEANSRITRFILICNYVTRIISPLASRCAKFRFQSLPPTSMKNRLQEIATKENCTINAKCLDTILDLAEGDMRRAVTTLQSVHSLGDDSINENDIAELAGLPPDSVVDELYDVLINPKTNFNTMQSSVENVSAAGYSAQSICGSLLSKFIVSSELNELGRAKLAIRIAEAEHHMIDGADEYLQLMTVCGLALECFRQSKA